MEAAASRKDLRQACYLDILVKSKTEFHYDQIKTHLMQRIKKDKDFSEAEMEAMCAPFKALYAHKNPAPERIEID